MQENLLDFQIYPGGRMGSQAWKSSPSPFYEAAVRWENGATKRHLMR